MDKYTFEDLIINPKIPNLESLIGKEVYCNDVPLACLDHANEHRGAGILREVRRESTDYPFRVEIPEGGILGFVCIIPEKEESEPKYVPFENAEEFLDAYYHNEISNLDGIYHYLATRGIWLEGRGEDAYYMVAEIWDDGVVLGDNKMETTKASSDKYFTINSTTTWGELYESFTFLNGTPCGRLVEEKYE